jgi:hypothetical protein
MEPDIDDFHNFMRATDSGPKDDPANLARVIAHASGEGRALEFAVAAIETLCEKGGITGADLCRLATLHGYENEAVARAWNTRLEFDLHRKAYRLDAPLARVLPLP